MIIGDVYIWRVEVVEAEIKIEDGVHERWLKFIYQVIKKSKFFSSRSE